MTQRRKSLERMRRGQEKVDPAEVDTVPLAALREEQLDHTTEIASSGGDPYRTAKSPHEYLRGPRRTLDDMRRLSEEIKRARAGKEPSK
jgi:hypothetical protein